jgi:hypothetical protein
MRITIPNSIIQQTTSETFQFTGSPRKVDPSDMDSGTEVTIDTPSEADIEEIRAIAEGEAAGEFLRVQEEVLATRSGQGGYGHPSFEAFLPLLIQHLRDRAPGISDAAARDAGRV